MSLHRWGVILVGIALVAILYSLPKIVVDNDKDEQVSRPQAEVSHGFDIPQVDQEKIHFYIKSMDSTSDKKIYANFADSLAMLYMAYNKLDSAAYFSSLILEKDSSLESHQRVGEIYFQLFGVTQSQELTKRFADKAAFSFEKVLQNQDNPDVRAKLAMTKVVTSNPMEGIMMLRGILDEYPQNETALYNLGVLSMQSGQYDKAVERFENLLNINPTHIQALYFLGVSLYETGQQEKAVEMFEKVKNTSNDPAIISSTEAYLKKLKEL